MATFSSLAEGGLKRPTILWFRLLGNALANYSIPQEQGGLTPINPMMITVTDYGCAITRNARLCNT